MVIFGVFDMLAYLYVANPLTEIFTLLLFFCMADLVSILMASGGDVGLDTPRETPIYSQPLPTASIVETFLLQAHTT
jgi:hypothetical protein